MSEVLSFKAGRVNFDEQTGEATPVRGQGTVVLGRSSEDDSLLALQWKPRSTYMRLSPSEELMILPGDVEFEPVKQCTTGRVISMKFTSSGKRHLYWLQDPPSGNLDEFSQQDEQILDRLRQLSNEGLGDEGDEEDEEMEE